MRIASLFPETAVVLSKFTFTKETTMNDDRIEGNWKELKGKVKETWGALTDDELDRIDGRTDQLAGAIQKHYGRTRDEAEKEIREWRENAES